MALSPHTQALIDKARAAAAARKLAELNNLANQLDKTTIGFSINNAIDKVIAKANNDAMTPSDEVARCATVNGVDNVVTVATQQPVTVFAHLPQFASPNGITLNAEQLHAKDLALQGKSFCLIGAAGTGKTTVTQDIINSIQRCSHVRPISDNTKHLTKDSPGVVVVGYTNKAINNIKKKLPAHLQSHCLTIHKLIEFAPVYFEVVDDIGNTRTTMRFEPARNAANPLPFISTIIIEESSMVGTDLFDQLMDAIAGRPQVIMLGDLNQLPPVFGPSILGFKLGELPTVELKTVYRQALLSPIISLATAIRTNSTAPKAQGATPRLDWHDANGMTVPSKLLTTTVVDRLEHGKLTVHPWKKRLHEKTALGTVVAFICKQLDDGAYNPDTDMLLCPFNKSFGTIEINRGIADHIAKTNDVAVHEVIARYARSYWAIGDKVLVDRHEAVITDIQPQPGYVGKVPRPASKTMKRDGSDEASGMPNPSADDILRELDGMGSNSDDSEAKNRASHVITVYVPDLGEEQRLTTAGEINNMLLGYCLTVHKSQGSEWNKVYVLLHNTHARGPALSRELLYTAVTRAKSELYIICEGDIAPYENSISLAASRPVIPGTTLAEKIEYFHAKRTAMGRETD
jgi:ATP-dependent exoDNAse (exonuclease V) alpha subunit